MKLVIFLLFLSFIGCASLNNKATLREKYVSAYRFGCLDVMWEQKNFCDTTDQTCQEAIQKTCNHNEERFKLFLRQNACYYEPSATCFKD